MFEWLTGQVSAVKTLRKILGTKPEKMADVIMPLSKKEVDDLFQYGQTTLANILPGYLINMEPNDFANLVKCR
ncbi:hypothetical protein P3T76_004126 [Phytophthora citrophthora]|uniref:Uncharacterized protein n=1 Tax=Phytophthora citrophthora TaxID=4793 RepID=A0AAD9LRK7_9STRA|nr:hypothetical protein P3T76_004126 [Phytophthora citrophthora]